MNRWISVLLGASLLLACAAVQADKPRVVTKPHNSLERQLLEVRQGKRPLSEFLDQLVDSQVVLLSKQDVLAQHTPADISALVLPTGKDNDEMLAVFTSTALAHRVADAYPEYRYGIETSFVWVLAHTAPGLGLTINPGWTLGMKIPSYGLLRMRDHYSKRIQQASN